MSRMVLMGIGNPLMRDDGIGVWVAKELQNAPAAKNMEVVVGETDVPYCLDCLQAGDFLVLLDAMYMGEAPGSVRMLPLHNAKEYRAKPHALHDMSLVDAIAAEHPDIRGYLVGIEPAVVGIGLDLSECLQSRFGQICADVEKLLGKAEEKNDE